MGYTVVGPKERARNTTSRHPVMTPVNSYGHPYSYCLILPDGEDYLYVDALEDALEFLLPGYSEVGEEERAMLRIRYAGEAAATVQATILASINPDEITDKEWEVLAAPKLGPQVAKADWWRSRIPLIVVETSYYPYTSSSRPASALSEGRKGDNLWWIRPADPETFLLSLHECGYLRILANVNNVPVEY